MKLQELMENKSNIGTYFVDFMGVCCTIFYNNLFVVNLSLETPFCSAIVRILCLPVRYFLYN